MQARGNLGIARAALGDREGAIRDFDRALELDPTYQPALENRRTILGLGPEGRLEAADLGEVDFHRERALAAGR